MAHSPIKQKASQRRVLVKEKHRQALELRKAGASFDVIAEQVGYANASGAWKAVRNLLKETIQEAADELRVVEYERLNHMLLILWPKVQIGEYGAIDRALRIMDKIDSLFGIMAPQLNLHQHQSEVVVIDGNKADYIEGLKAARVEAIAMQELSTGNGASDDTKAAQS